MVLDVIVKTLHFVQHIHKKYPGNIYIPTQTSLSPDQRDVLAQ